jgi:protein XRP2
MQFMQVADKLAAAGFLVVAPDVFRGKPWSMDKFPPKPEDNFMPWLQGYSWEVSELPASRSLCVAWPQD